MNLDFRSSNWHDLLQFSLWIVGQVCLFFIYMIIFTQFFLYCKTFLLMTSKKLIQIRLAISWHPICSEVPGTGSGPSATLTRINVYLQLY